MRGASRVKALRRQQQGLADAISAAVIITEATIKAVKYLHRVHSAVAGNLWHASIPETDPIYADAHQAVASLVETKQAVKITAVDGGICAAWELPTTNNVVIDGYKFTVYEESLRNAPVQPNLSSLGAASDDSIPEAQPSSSSSFKPLYRQLRFTTRDEAAFTYLVDTWLVQLADCRDKREHPPKFAVAQRWGWSHLTHVPQRSIDSVILADGQMERIVDDVSDFLAGRDDYERRCIPWHRGYLFHGPPGTGKTSVARAIATQFDLDVFYLPLGDLQADTDLLELVVGIRPGARGAILLLEDVDIYSQVSNRDNPDSKIATMSGLLNSLDGIATPPGLISILTTNRLDVIDSALLRPGRVDVVEYFDLLTPVRCDYLYKWFYQQSPPYGIEWPERIAAAALTELFRQHPDGILPTLLDLKDVPIVV